MGIASLDMGQLPPTLGRTAGIVGLPSYLGTLGDYLKFDLEVLFCFVL